MVQCLGIDVLLVVVIVVVIQVIVYWTIGVHYQQMKNGCKVSINLYWFYLEVKMGGMSPPLLWRGCSLRLQGMSSERYWRPLHLLLLDIWIIYNTFTNQPRKSNSRPFGGGETTLTDWTETPIVFYLFVNNYLVNPCGKICRYI